MAAWRRRAIELFPDLREEIVDPDNSIYFLFGGLRHRAWKAHAEDDAAELAKIYGFAAWCYGQRTGELANAAGVAFYEHLFDATKDRDLWAKIVARIDPRIARDVWGLWELRLTESELVDLRRLFTHRNRRS